MEKIGIIGSSLIMSFYASLLSRKYRVTVFEANDIGGGGSWKASKFNDVVYPVFNNIVCPANKFENNFIPEIATLINNSGGNVEVRNEKLKLRAKYSPQHYIVGDFFSVIIKNLRTVTEIKKDKINILNVLSDGFVINGNFYDKLLIP